MSATAQGITLRCDKHGCNAPATVDQDAWSFCATHAGSSISTTVPGAPLRQVPAAPPVSPIGQLLEQASGHSNVRIRKAAERIEAQLGSLRGLVAEHAADEARKKADAEAKAKARAEVEQLEAQLAAAKAKLRGAARTSRGGNTKPRTQAQLDALAKGRAAKAAKRAAEQAAQ
jgi:hypothetical protein